MLVTPVQAPSPWVTRFAHLGAGRVLDVAGGHGRHALFFHERGLDVTLIDIAPGVAAQPGLCVVQADMEHAPWPLHHEGAVTQFDTVIVTNYLWRPLLPTVLASVASGGVLLYETFAHGNELHGKPTRPEFLLRPLELLDLCKDLEVIAYEAGFLPNPDRVVQRICAVRSSLGRSKASPLQTPRTEQ